jgi:hypothetical protein
MTSIPHLNDGSARAPRLRIDINMGNLWALPDWSQGPKGDELTVLTALKEAGFEGVQGGDSHLPHAKALGLGCTVSGRINKVGEIAPLADAWAAAGFEAATLHVGWGHEDDATIDALVQDVIRASAASGLPIFIETHRATITQDTWRTVRMIERNPELRINGDFSHWWTGCEMAYGDLEEKLAFLAPVFERVRFMHARLGNNSHIQMPMSDPTMVDPIAAFRSMWTRSMAGFLATARPGDFLPFNPELLPASCHYAHEIPGPDGILREASDRWLEALQYVELAKSCWAAASAAE